jgi:hypothetical protein
MSRPQVKEHNIETDEIIVRDMTDFELAEYEAFQEAELQKIEDAKIAALAKAAAEAKLAALGLTTDDLKALGLN